MSNSFTSVFGAGGGGGTDATKLPLTGGTLTGALTLPNAIFSGLSLSGSQATNTLDVSTTWNTTGNPALIFGRATNTASGASSRLVNLGTIANGVLFSVSSAANTEVVFGDSSGAFGVLRNGQDTVRLMASPNGIVRLGGLGEIQWTTGFASASATTILLQDGNTAGVVAQRNGTNAQTKRVYGTYTDASNYVRASLASSSTLVTLAAETAGTGADNVDINITTAGTGLVNLATQSASVDAVLASTHTARIKIGGTEYKILLSTI